jgi:hypothetical protein
MTEDLPMKFRAGAVAGLISNPSTLRPRWISGLGGATHPEACPEVSKDVEG